jgi:signal transduction histidine kinase
MELLAGINLAWTAFYILISIALVAIYLRFGRNRDYLIFAVVCAELSVYSASRVAFYLATDFQSIVMPGKVMLACLGPATATLLHLAMRRASVSGRRLVAASVLVHVIGVGYMIASLMGGALDYTKPMQKPISLGFTKMILREYELSSLGLVIACLAVALLAGWFLYKSYRNDRLNKVLIVTAFTVLGLFTINDILLATNLVQSIYVVEHGFFFFILGVLTGFLREFERSREQLRLRSEALEEASRSLEQLTDDLSESTIRLDRARSETYRLRPMADLGRLSASLAHEIRNPLAVLSNVASTLRRHGTMEGGDREFDSLVEMLQEETDRLARLVDDLLLFSQSGRLSREPVEAGPLVELAVSDVREIYGEEPRPHIEIDVEDSLPPIPGSVESLRRAYVNLIVNAIQSSNGGGSVKVVARRNPNRRDVMMFGVEDRAGGIPENVLAEVFEPFFSTRPTGTGLGLPIVKSIVEAHDGELLVENRPGKGASFWMCLPVVSRDVSAH